MEKFNYEGLCKTLEQLSDFEKKTNLRVVQFGVLKGLNLEDIKWVGQGLIIQDGCTSLFQKILKNDNLKADVNVLSYCWCGDFIRSVFSSGHMRPDCFNPYKDRCNLIEYMLRDFVLFASGNLNPSRIFMYISLSMDPYNYAVISSMRRISSSSETAKLIKKRNVIASMTGEYVSS